MFRFLEPVMAILQMVCLPLLLARGLGLQGGWASRWYTGIMLLGLMIILGHGCAIPQSITFGLILLLIFGMNVRAKHSLQARSPLAARERACLTVVVAVLALPAAGAILRAVHNPVADWDAFAIWFAKARAVSEWVPVNQMPYRNYPELGPVLWMSAFKWIGPAQESTGRAIFPLLYFVWMVSLMDAFDRPYSWSTTLAILLSALLVFDARAMTSGYQDGFVLVGAGFAASQLVRILVTSPREKTALLRHLREPAQRWELVRAGFLTGVIALIKQEGTVWSLILTGSFLLVWLASTHPSAWRGLARALLPFVGPWLATVAVWPTNLALNEVDVRAIQGDGFSVSSILNAFQQVDRWPVIKPYVSGYLEDYSSLLTLSGVGSVAAFTFAPATRRAIALLWIVLVLHLAFVTLVFFATREDLAWHLGTAFGRLTAQGGFAFALLAFLTLASLLRCWAADFRRLAELSRQARAGAHTSSQANA